METKDSLLRMVVLIDILLEVATNSDDAGIGITKQTAMLKNLCEIQLTLEETLRNQIVKETENGNNSTCN